MSKDSIQVKVNLIFVIKNKTVAYQSFSLLFSLLMSCRLDCNQLRIL